MPGKSNVCRNTLCLRQSGHNRLTTQSSSSSSNVNAAAGDSQRSTCGDHSETTDVIDGSHNTELPLSIDGDGGGSGPLVSASHGIDGSVDRSTRRNDSVDRSVVDVDELMLRAYGESLVESDDVELLVSDYWVNSWRKVVWLRGMHYDVPGGAGPLGYW